MLASQPASTSGLELWAAFFINLLISLVYLLAVFALGRLPDAAELFGHALGILGFLLMLLTEVLYSLRKRSLNARWGRLSGWLRFHIITGLVGPYMVLLHSSWKFNGLAGVVTLFTLVIVLSGFVGRYIYTAIPRTADGIEMEAEALRRAIAELDARLAERNSPSRDAKTSREIKRLEQRRQTLQRQVNALARTRRMLAVWHIIHVPLGIVLFTAAMIHIIAAVYYATLPRLFGG